MILIDTTKKEPVPISSRNLKDPLKTTLIDPQKEQL